jgi:predicted enzyme related to lactoylglutathione lyase
MDWFELATNDPEKAGAFYEQVLGWTVNSEEFDGTPYTTCLRGEEPVAGILPAEALPEGVPPNWSVYFAVEDCTAVVEKAQQTGGELLFGPHEMPRVGRFAGLRDPQGAAFAVIQPTSPEDSSGDEADGESEGGKSEGADGADGKSEGAEDKAEGKSEGKDGAEGKSEGKHESDDKAASKDEPDDAVQDGEADTKGEPNEELKKQNEDRGEAQADGQSDDSGVR